LRRQEDRCRYSPISGKRQALEQLLIDLYRVGPRRLHLVHAAHSEGSLECDRHAAGANRHRVIPPVRGATEGVHSATGLTSLSRRITYWASLTFFNTTSTIFNAMSLTDAEQLRAARSMTGLTQAELAEKSGVSLPTIERL